MKYNVRKLTVVEAWEDKDRFYEALEDALDETGDAACWPTLQPYRALVVHETADFLGEGPLGGWDLEDVDRHTAHIVEAVRLVNKLQKTYWDELVARI